MQGHNQLSFFSQSLDTNGWTNKPYLRAFLAAVSLTDGDIVRGKQTPGLDLNYTPYTKTITPIGVFVSPHVLGALCLFPLGGGECLEGWDGRLTEEII